MKSSNPVDSRSMHVALLNLVEGRRLSGSFDLRTEFARVPSAVLPPVPIGLKIQTAGQEKGALFAMVLLCFAKLSLCSAIIRGKRKGSAQKGFCKNLFY